mmetsp:Transcript_20966/g.53298  ORF Transcript_20966/g.53298 Transcript_20966/m.53298 type:complete len:237 (+) Transcript_20966:161-871(+)
MCELITSSVEGTCEKPPAAGAAPALPAWPDLASSSSSLGTLHSLALLPLLLPALLPPAPAPATPPRAATAVAPLLPAPWLPPTLPARALLTLLLLVVAVPGGEVAAAAEAVASWLRAAAAVMSSSTNRRRYRSPTSPCEKIQPPNMIMSVPLSAHAGDMRRGGGVPVTTGRPHTLCSRSRYATSFPSSSEPPNSSSLAPSRTLPWQRPRDRALWGSLPRAGLHHSQVARSSRHTSV